MGGQRQSQAASQAKSVISRSKIKHETNDRGRQPTLTSASTCMLINMFTTHTHKHVHTHTSHTQTKQKEKQKQNVFGSRIQTQKVKTPPSAQNHQITSTMGKPVSKNALMVSKDTTLTMTEPVFFKAHM